MSSSPILAPLPPSKTGPLRGGARPLVVCGPNTMPAPLIEGGQTLGTYGYNIRQPKDYEAWRFYLESMLQWLIDQYGREEVKHWGFMYGIEADWQAKAVYPGTDTEMNWEDNRREFIRQLDYFHAACEAKLGPTVYVGCYFAMETQAAMYFEHWARGTNYATGLRGTRIGFCGLSDWTHVGKFAWNPFDPEGRNKRDEWGYIAGLPYRYNYLENLLAQYPELRRLEVALPEAGYIDPQGGAFPAPVSYADSRGAALYGLRLMAYATCPRLTWAFNRYALSVGDMEYSWDDSIKPPLFNAIRVQQKLAGERQLPVLKSGEEVDPDNEVRLVAASADDPLNTHRLVLVNFSEKLDESVPEEVEVTLHGLPEGARLSVTEYLTDADHNNWWADWVACREETGLGYPERLIYGTNQVYKPDWAPWMNTITATLAPEEYGKWAEKRAEYQDAAELMVTSGSYEVDSAAGIATLRFSLPGHSLLYVEFGWPGSRLVEQRALSFEGGRLAGWQRSGLVTLMQEAGRSSLAVPGLLPCGCGCTLWKEITNLVPGGSYTFSGWAKASGRVMDYALELEQPATRQHITGWGDRSGDWNRIVVTGRADENGELIVRLLSPDQPVGDNDYVVFDELALTAN